MAFEEIKEMGMDGDRGLVAGRSQREKRRSYKDLLREEEEIAAEVRKSSKKRPKDAEMFMMGTDSHKKKKKHSDDYYYRDYDGSGPSSHKKKHKSVERSPTLSSPADTAMGLLQAITSPLATGTDPSPHLHKKPSYPSFSSHSSKDRKREGGNSGGGGGGASKGSHAFSHSRPSSSSSSKKHSSKSSLFHGGALKEEPLTLREADGLKMKLIMSPEKEESEGFMFSSHSSSKSSVKKEKDKDRMQIGKSPKKKTQQSREPLPVVGKEVEVEGHYGGGLGDDSSSSGGELEAGELVIDDSYSTHMSKKKKKSKKSKKKKDKEKERDREKSGKDKKHSKGFGDSSRHSHSHPTVTHCAVGPMYAMSAPLPPHHHHPVSEPIPEKKKKKEDKDRDKHDKDKPKKKTTTTAYQVFCKEYRVNINAEHPGLVFGELSKKLAEVWKAMPEKDKQVWRQKAQHLQHKQNKAEATTVKHKSSTESKGKVSGSSVGLVSPSKGHSAVSLSPARVPEVDPIDAAAHLQLLGESLSLIGHRLQETEGMVAVSGSLSVLLDSILCALGPLTCLTAQIPQLNGCPRKVLSNTLDNIAYIMPGL